MRGLEGIEVKRGLDKNFAQVASQGASQPLTTAKGGPARLSGKPVSMIQRVDNEEAVEKLRYMHRNPVKRGLVNLPEQWCWSSCRFYFLDEAGPVRVNEGWGKISFQAPVA